MKKLIFLSVFLMTVFFVNAQTMTGTFYLGGSTKFNTSLKKVKVGDYYESDLSQISLVPKIGMFISDNLLLGVDLIYNYEEEKENSKTKNKKTTYGIMPVFKYYIPTDHYHSQNHLRLFLEAGAGWNRYKTSHTDYSNSLIYKFGAGLSYFLKRNLSFDIGIDFTRSDRENTIDSPADPQEDTSVTITENSLNLSFGISLYFE